MNVQQRTSYNVKYKTKEGHSYLTFYSERDRDNYLESYVLNVLESWVDLYYYVSGSLYKFSNVTDKQLHEVRSKVSSLTTEEDVASYLQQLELLGLLTKA